MTMNDVKCEKWVKCLVVISSHIFCHTFFLLSLYRMNHNNLVNDEFFGKIMWTMRSMKWIYLFFFCVYIKINKPFRLIWNFAKILNIRLCVCRTYANLRSFTFLWCVFLLVFFFFFCLLLCVDLFQPIHRSNKRRTWNQSRFKAYRYWWRESYCSKICRLQLLSVFKRNK